MNFLLVQLAKWNSWEVPCTNSLFTKISFHLLKKITKTKEKKEPFKCMRLGHPMSFIKTKSCFRVQEHLDPNERETNSSNSEPEYGNILMYYSFKFHFLWSSICLMWKKMCISAENSVLIFQNHQFSINDLHKRDSGTGVFLWILRNFLEYLFDRAPRFFFVFIYIYIWWWLT